MHKWLLCLFLLVGGVINAQERTHHVEKGETLYSLARAYQVTVEALVEANPVLSEGLKEGQDLVIPNSTVRVEESVEPDTDSTKFDYYTVQPKETVYSLTHQWGISAEKLLELNPSLEEGLKIGQVLTLPKGTLKATAGSEPNRPVAKPGFIRYTVKAKETVYSLVRTFEWTRDSLFLLNPSIEEEGLKAGSVIWVPETKFSATLVLTDSIFSLNTRPKVDTIAVVDSAQVEPPKPKYIVVRTESNDDWESVQERYNVTREELIRLNPELISFGIQPDRNLIVPRPADSVALPENIDASNFAFLSQKTIHIGVALPLYLEENDSLSRLYSMGEAAPNVYSRSRIAYDFYSGFKLAIDTLRAYGLNVEVDIYDTRNDKNTVRQIANKLKKNTPDFLIGPLYSANAELLAAELPDLWIVSPLSRTVNNANLPKLVQAVSNIEAEHRALAQWVNDSAQDANIIFVLRDLEEERKAVYNFKLHLEASENRSISTLFMGEDLITRQSIQAKLAAGKRDVFIVLDSDPVLLASFVNNVTKVKDTSITVMTTSRLLQSKTLEIEKLNRLDLYISDVEYVNYRDAHVNAFIGKYRTEMGTEPPRFAYHGYDVAMYFLPSFVFGQITGTPLWGPFEGLMKVHQFDESRSEEISNEGVYLLHLQNYHWHRIF